MHYGLGEVWYAVLLCFCFVLFYWKTYFLQSNLINVSIVTCKCNVNELSIEFIVVDFLYLLNLKSMLKMFLSTCISKIMLFYINLYCKKYRFCYFCVCYPIRTMYVHIYLIFTYHI